MLRFQILILTLHVLKVLRQTKTVPHHKEESCEMVLKRSYRTGMNLKNFMVVLYLLMESEHFPLLDFSGLFL